MGFLREIQTALREGLDELLNAGVSRDDVDQIVELLEHDITEAKTELDLARRDESRLSSRIDRERREAERLRDQARAAVDQGDDEKGRELIRRRRRAVRGVEILERQAAEHIELIGLLEAHIEELEDKLQEVQLRRDFLRTRHRVQSLRERYEAYQRDFQLGDLPTLDTDLGLDRPSSGEEIDLYGDEEDLDDDDVLLPQGPLTPRRRNRLGSDEGEPEPAPQPLGGRAELPLEAHEEAGLRVEGDEEAVPRRRRGPRDLALERELMLRDIERKTRSGEFEEGIEDELRRLKRDAGQVVEEPDEPEDEPEPPAEPAEATADEGDGEPPAE